ncbi:tail fiber protein [Xenorhabdus bovienii]|uniref:tail fiber protein n=1 Tax=Xenorhabdus bovienii TaxID=40576 RepID=UPI0023B284BC|nr:tail fiber protein [Xenorhabdus bovienii]MDE9430788.1 phage tail protein [Xenorhabdus bovienii]MDE9488431.1 phage tail protein [Xenorhabdus bovienii]MDE9504810.1 phage tail protein [Xenorhabdus bovienii]MDE9546282.1 phage tail protein [Xenorhabdus bovienii]
MSESNVSKTIQEQQKSSNPNAIGPDIKTLKNKFKEGSIPLQTDFRELIDIADIGRKAVGQAFDQKGSLKGMSLDENGILQLKINEEYESENNSPLKLDNDVLVVGLGNGIKSDANGIAVDPKTVLPRGMIVMFSGDSAPEGWAFCDGKTEGTPDLRNRFIACGNTIEESGGKSEKPLSGEKNNKTYSVTTNKIKTGLTVTVNDTKLEPDQLPEHFHYDGMPYDSENGNLHGITAEEPISNIGIHKKSYDVTLHGMVSFESFMNRFNPGWRSEFKFRILNNSDSVVKKDYKVMYKFHTSPVGSGKGHTHTASVTDPEHSHKVDITPPYYLLAFIMKL